MKSKKEFITYLVSGGITTAVNYILFAGLLFLQLPYLAANSVAWVGAVLTSYMLNRLWVFHSKRQIAGELASFAALRFMTLMIENIMLWLLIDLLNVSTFPAKFIVSVTTVIGNYVLCKFGIFKKEVTCHG